MLIDRPYIYDRRTRVPYIMWVLLVSFSFLVEDSKKMRFQKMT